MKRILFVEDDAVIAKVYSQKLLAVGFEIQVAEDGLAAVQRLRAFKPDLVVLDLLMPKLDGVDVLKFIRRDPALGNTRIIVFSNSFLGDLLEQVAAIGVEQALVKASVSPTQLIDVVIRTLDQPARTFLTAAELAKNLAGDNAADPAAPDGTTPAG